MEFVRTFTETFDVGAEAELSVDNRSGTVSIRGDDTTQVRIEVVARLWGESDSEADDQADLIRRGIKHDGKRVTVRAPSLLRPHPIFFFGRGPRIEYQITVPKRTTAKLISRSGRIEVEGLAGRLEIEAASGRVNLREIGNDVQIVSRSGSVQAEGITGSLAIESRSGGARIAGCGGDVTVQSRSGSHQIEDVAGSFRLESRSGSVAVADVRGAVSIKSRSGSVRYEGPVGGNFDIDVASGSIKLAFDADSVFMLDAHALSGSVRSDFPVRRSAPSGAASKAPTVRIRALSGSVHIGPR